jgi:hypothetical protein
MRLISFTDIRNEAGDLYLRRFYIYRGKHRPHIYLHHIMRSDEDRALHDHPWAFLSIMLKGSYTEVTPYTGQNVECVSDVRFDRCYGGPVVEEKISALAIVRHNAADRHRLILRPGFTVWTLVFAGEREREWGFWGKGIFIHWKKWNSAENRCE